MTQQFPEQLTSHHQCLDFTDLALYRLFRGIPEAPEPLVYPTPPTPNSDIYCTALDRGYVAELVLDADGFLTVVAFRYCSNVADQAWNIAPMSDRIDGDFWLDFRPEYWGDQTFVPFRDGRLVCDRSEWRTSE